MKKCISLLIVGLLCSVAHASHLPKLKRTYSMHSPVELLKSAIDTNDVGQVELLSGTIFPTGLHCQWMLLGLSRSQEMTNLLIARIIQDWRSRLIESPRSSIEEFLFGYNLILKECEITGIALNSLEEISLINHHLTISQRLNQH